MSDYIEFLGPPGVGKSTILAELSRRTPGAAWRAHEAALRARPYWRDGLRRGVESSLMWATGRPDRRVRNAVAEEYMLSQPSLASAVWSSLSKRYTGARAGVRFQRAAHWFDRAGAVAVVAAQPSGRPVVFDEALLHPDYFPPNATDVEVDQLLGLLRRLPHAAVLFDAPAETILWRQSGRASPTITMASLSRDEALLEVEDLRDVSRVVAERLGSNGVPVLQVNTMERWDVVLTRVTTFLRRTDLAQRR